MKKDITLKSEDVIKRINELSDKTIDSWEEIYDLISRYDGGYERMMKTDLKKLVWKVKESLNNISKEIEEESKNLQDVRSL